MRTVLVTGATGRVGTNLALALRDRGWRVRGMVHPEDPAVERLRRLAGVAVATAGLDDAAGIAAAVEGADAVVHLAAQMIRGDTPVDAFYDVNTLGTLRVLEAAARVRRPVGRFVLASTDGVYRPTRLSYSPADEQHPTVPADHYGTSKLLAEQLVRNVGAQFDLPWSIVRYGSVVAPDETLSLFRYRWTRGLLQHARSGRDSHLWPLFEGCARPAALLDAVVADRAADPAVALTGPGGQWALHLTDVRDTVEGTVLALEHPAAVGEVLNIVGPGPVGFVAGAHTVAAALDLPVVDVALPVRFAFAIDHGRATRLLGYRPVWDFGRMVESALRYRQGGLPGVVGAAGAGGAPRR